MTIGERIRSLRKKQGLSISALARRAQMTDGALHQIESGVTKSPSFENGLRLARALGISPYDLLENGSRPAGKTQPRDLAAEIDDLRIRVDALEKPPRDHRRG